MALFSTFGSVAAATAAVRPRDVVLVIIDDFRGEIAAEPYGKTYMHTPNLDKFVTSQGSTAFTNAYVQQAQCGPSRTSFLTGRRPDTTHVYDINANFRQVGGGSMVTLPQHFLNNGYQTRGFGKVFHPNVDSSENAYSWSQNHTNAPDQYWCTYADTNPEKPHCQQAWNALTPEQEEEHAMIDEQVVDLALDALDQLASCDKPFFIAIGLIKPHLPFDFPKRFLDYYPVGSAASWPMLPSTDVFDGPGMAYFASGELTDYDSIGVELNYNGQYGNPLPDEEIIALRRAYFASTSYMDEQFGRIIDRIDSLPSKYGRNDTLVFVFGDHGYSLGDHQMWNKHSEFDVATRTPLIVRDPTLSRSALTVKALVEFVDIFPTVTELVGIEIPPLCPEVSSGLALCTEGTSMVPLIQNVTNTGNASASWKPAAYTQFVRWCQGSNFGCMGYSAVTERFRYTEYVDFNETVHQTNWKMTKDTPNQGVEFYDHEVDPLEEFNLAQDKNYAALAGDFAVLLHAGWRQHADGSRVVLPNAMRCEDILHPSTCCYTKDSQGNLCVSGSFGDGSVCKVWDSATETTFKNEIDFCGHTLRDPRTMLPTGRACASVTNTDSCCQSRDGRPDYDYVPCVSGDFVNADGSSSSCKTLTQEIIFSQGEGVDYCIGASA